MASHAIRRTVATPGAARLPVDGDWLAAMLAMAMAFLIAAGNGRYPWWGGLGPSLLVPPVLILLAGRGRLESLRLPAAALLPGSVLAGLALVAAISAVIMSPTWDALYLWSGTYLSPCLIYAGMLALRPGPRLVAGIWAAFTAGALVPMGLGLLAYHEEWGLPTGLELLLSRYSLERMAGYMAMTFGNTGNMAALLALLVPAWLSRLLQRDHGPGSRGLYALALVLALGHVLIVQSRTLYLVLLVVLPLIAWFHRVKLLGALAGAMALGAVLALPLLEASDRLLELTVGALGGTADDQSVSERVEAMGVGWRLLLDNPALGVGPGGSFVQNPFTTAHQYWIHQGAEIGWLGLLLAGALSLLVFARFAAQLRRRCRTPADGWRFANLVGPAAFMLYGCIANMPLSTTVVNVWVGLFALLLGLAETATDEGSTDRRPASPEGS